MVALVSVFTSLRLVRRRVFLFHLSLRAVLESNARHLCTIGSPERQV